MKKIYSFVLLAVILLLSKNVVAQNVAKVSIAGTTTEYATIEDAMIAWQSNAGTLTLLANCNYAPEGVFTISKKDTLNLNGFTLNWTADVSAAYAIEVSSNKLIINGNGAENSILAFDCKKGGAYAIYANKAIIGVNNITISAKADSGNGHIISMPKGSTSNFSTENSILEMGDNIKYGVWLGGQKTTKEATFKNVTISSVGTMPFASAAIYTCRPCAYENLVVDMSKSEKVCYGVQFAQAGTTQIISGDNTSITTNSVAGSLALNANTLVTLTINAGMFTAPQIVDVTASNYQPEKTTINGGKFSALLPYNVQTPTGKILQKGADGYYTLQDGVYKFAIIGNAASDEFNKIGFTDAASCWNACSSDPVKTTNVKVFTQEDFTIPVGKYIQLCKVSNEAVVGTITNNATIALKDNSTSKPTTIWNNKIINNGTLSLERAIYGDNFELVNTGTVTINTNALFAAKALEQVKAYISEGYAGYPQDNGYYKLMTSETMVAMVGAYGYDILTDALKASTKDNPAKLCKDYTVSGTLYTPDQSDNKHCYLDLNGFDIIDNGNDKYLWSNTNAYLTIQGQGTIISKGNKRDGNTVMFTMTGRSEPTVADYSVLEIGKDVTIDVENFDYVFGINGVGKGNADAYGVRVGLEGKINSKYYLASVSGTITNTVGNVPTINIASTAEITCQEGIYAAGYAKWNFAGKMTAENYGVEIRAGEFTMTGGAIEATMNKPADDQFNGNGSTSQACAISAMQHDTKLPISVVINGGELKAYTPIYQANPQKNSEEDIKKVSVVVNNSETGVGPKIYSTSNNIVWSANKVVTLNGGVYNLNPAAYVAEGKAVVENTNTGTKAMYPYTIGEKAVAVTTAKAGNWNETATWEGGVVPTTATPVVIKHNVAIPQDVKAQTYGIDVQGGTITVEGALAIGNGGIKGITNANQLLVKDGAAMVISPAAAKENSQPLATVYKKLNIRHKAEGEYKEGVESPYLREHIGIPTLEKPQKNISLLYRQWNTVSGWEDATEYGTPFKGYSVTDETTPKEDVSFAGKLVGNKDAILNMPRQEFHFVANSWVAPINTIEVLNQVGKLSNNDATEVALKIFIPETKTINGEKHSGGTFKDINKITLEDEQEAWGKIAPMQAFFLFANEPTTITLSYEQAAWNTMLAAKSAAPKRIMGEEENVKVRIRLTAKDGHEDNVTLKEGESFHSTKMMNESPNVNIYVDSEAGNYSTFVTEDLEGTTLKIQTNDQTEYTLSFDRLKGETLAIKDLETGAITTMTAENTYTFKATANTTIRRFVITRKEVPSSVEDITVSGVKGVYTIMGQFLGENVDLNTLPQGIYVIDGQKYIK